MITKPEQIDSKVLVVAYTYKKIKILFKVTQKLCRSLLSQGDHNYAPTALVGHAFILKNVLFSVFCWLFPCLCLEILENTIPHPFFERWVVYSFKTTLDYWKCNPGELYRKNRIAVKRVAVRLGPSLHFVLARWPRSKVRVRVWVSQLHKNTIGELALLTLGAIGSTKSKLPEFMHLFFFCTFLCITDMTI